MQTHVSMHTAQKPHLPPRIRRWTACRHQRICCCAGWLCLSQLQAGDAVVGAWAAAMSPALSCLTVSVPAPARAVGCAVLAAAEALLSWRASPPPLMEPPQAAYGGTALLFWTLLLLAALQAALLPACMAQRVTPWLSASQSRMQSRQLHMESRQQDTQHAHCAAGGARWRLPAARLLGI